MELYIPDKKELESIIKQAIKETLEKKLPPLIEQATNKKYLSRTEVKDLTGFNDRRLQYLRDQNKISYSQDGRKILYLRESIEQYINDYSNINEEG